MPEETIKVALASLSDSSLRQYEGTLKKWWAFCHRSNTRVFEAQIADVLKFLTNEFENGAAYGSINSARSAIALILGPEIGINPLIKRFCKGVSKLRPAKPKYDRIWDPKIVLDFVGKWFPYENMSLEILSQKTVTLLALATGHRIQTLAAIDRRNCKKIGERIEIKIPARLKTSKHNHIQPTLILPIFKDNPAVCVASAVEQYIKTTENIRKEENALFISWKKPHKAVSSQTLSRWIKNTLQKSGINTSIFSAYSTRHASTSAAKRSGVSIDTIRKTAGWTARSKTFARFYDREIGAERDSFAKAILNCK